MIDSYSFGKIVINGKEHSLDPVITKEKVEYRTVENRHSFGLHEIKKVVEKYSPNFIVIGNGESGVAKIEQETIDYLKEKNIDLGVDLSQNAIHKYNKLEKEGKKVVAIIHLTC